MPITEVGDIEFTAYFIILRDAFIYRKMQTKEGQEWLDNAWRLEQTEPERERLREKFGKGV